MAMRTDLAVTTTSDTDLPPTPVSPMATGHW